MLAPLALAATFFFAATYEEGTVLTYRGSFQPVKVDRPEEGKSFELTLVIGAATDAGTPVFWLLEDSGSNPIAWQDRFGTFTWQREKRVLEGTIPGFLFAHTTGKTRVNLAPPLPLFAANLKQGDSWTEEQIQFEVEAGEAHENRPTWNVVARTLVGRRRTMQIDREEGRVYSVRENVFVGQGEEHLLKYQQVVTQVINAEALKQTFAAITAWNSAREEWLVATEDRSPRKITAARKAVVELLPELKKKSAETPLTSLSEVAARQLKADGEQTAALGAMRSKLLGKKLPQFELKDIANKTWDNAALEDRVTVFQFWSYRDENLHEPYGQVGYLDYLARRHEKVLVLGVAVPPENLDPTSSLRAQVRKFRDFMNVSYPILLDQDLLAAVGDPRKLGGELPLFVVVDRQGKIIEVKAGFYEVKRDEGLAELEAIVKTSGK